MKIAVIVLALAACAPFADGDNLKGTSMRPRTRACANAITPVASLSFPLHCTAPLFNADTPTAIEGEYIVVFKQEMEDDDCK